MQNEFYTIASFEYTAEAQMLKGKFISEDIEVFLKDEHTVDVDPLISNAIGGVKLQVRSKDKEKALKIYNNWREYEKDEFGKPIRCINCKSERVIIAVPSKKIIYLLVLKKLYLIYQ